MKVKVSILIFASILLTVSSALNSTYPTGCLLAEDSFSCYQLTDDDLPILDTFSGHSVSFYRCNFQHLDSSSFPNLKAKSIYFEDSNLNEIESGFWSKNGREKLVESVSFYRCWGLSKFPFADLEGFDSLKSLMFYRTSIDYIPGGLTWPLNLSDVRFIENFAAITILPFTFFNAPNLKILSFDIRANGAETLVKTNGLALLSKDCDLTFLSSNLRFEPDAFEYGSAQKMTIYSTEFPEETFRYLLKRKLDEGKQSFLNFYSGVPYGPIKLSSCEGCEIAWLYKDAQKYGFETYQSLIGSGNVQCPQIGPILETSNTNFIQEMEKCPETEMSVPQPNYCQGAENDVVNDPINCQCFYACQWDTTIEHICCQRPLVFNANGLICDWPENVPNC